jgi:hypothetical protein
MTSTTRPSRSARGTGGRFRSSLWPARPLRLALTATLAFDLAGCSSTAGAAGNGPTSDPYDAYRVADLQTIDGAHKLETYECLADGGFPQLLENDPDPQGGDLSQGLDAGEDLWFASEDQARTNGFGHDEPGSIARFQLADPAYHALTDQCTASAWQKLGPDAEQTMVSYAQLGNKLRSGTFKTIDRKFPEFRDRIFDCLKKEGAPVSQQEGNEWGISFNLPLGSLEGEAQQKTEGLQTGFSEATPERKYLPTPEESRVAVQVHRCAVDTGVKDEVRELAYRDRDKTIATVEVALTELNEKIAGLANTAAALRGQ